MTFTFIDYIIILLYFTVLLYIGFFASKTTSTAATATEDYLLAGRRLTLPIFVATLVATWYGNILGMGEFVYTKGVLAWTCFALPYYISATLFAYFVAGRIRTSGSLTIPDQIRTKYGSLAGWISSFIVLIITIPAAYILMLGVLIDMATGMGPLISILVGAILSFGYLFTGGFKADVLTNTLQFFLMYAGFAILLYFSIASLGSPAEMVSHLPRQYLEPTGGASWQYIAAWFVISLQTFIDPSFHQRCAAARNPQTARRGILISVACWAVFDFLTLTTGLYAKVFITLGDPVMAYPLLGEQVLGPAFKGLFFVSLLAVVMSSLDSYAFLSAATIGNDLLTPIKAILPAKYVKTRNISTRSLTRLGLAAAGIAGITMAFALPSAIGLIYKTASVAVPGLLLPLTVSFSKKFYLTKSGCISLMILSSGVAAILTFARLLPLKAGSLLYTFLQEVEPMTAGIVVSILLGIGFVRRTKGGKNF